MKIIKLPIKAANLSYEEAQKFYDMGMSNAIDESMMDITLHVNVDHIVAFNEDSNGNTTLYLSNDPEPFMIEIPFNVFLKLLND